MQGHLNFIGQAFLFFLFWLAVSGSFHWQQLLAGVFTALFVAWFNRSLLIKPRERPPVNFNNLVWFAVYCLRLLVDIVKANFQVARLVLHPRMPIAPRIVPLTVDLERVADRVLLGNSITLTPGTLTVLADEKKFLVHGLTAESVAGLEQWDLIVKLKQMEEGR